MYCKKCGNWTENASGYCHWCENESPRVKRFEHDSNDFLYYYLEGLRKFGDFESRSTLKEYWLFVLGNFVVFTILPIIATIVVIIPFIGFLLAILLWIFVALFALISLIPGLSAAIRRLHDTNRSGWMVLLALVPLIGQVIVIVMLAQEGTPGYNDYGPDPREDRFY